MPPMEAVPALEPRTDTPPLTAARVRRRLTVESAAKLARLTPDEVTWLEEGRLYRFPSSDSALLALLLYSTALGIGRREARQLAGLPLIPVPPRRRVGRFVGIVAAVIAVSVAGALVVPGLVQGSQSPPPPVGAKSTLPPTWRSAGAVLNGNR